MLVIQKCNGSVAIDWKSIESLHFDDSESPDSIIRVVMKSGGFITILNPTEAGGEKVDFNRALNAWVSDYTCWEIKENNTNKAPNCFPM